MLGVRRARQITSRSHEVRCVCRKVWLEPPLPLANNSGCSRRVLLLRSSLTVKLTAVLPAAFVAAPACGRVTPKPVQLEEPNGPADGPATPDGPVVFPEAVLHGYAAVAADIVGSYETARRFKAERKAKHEKKMAAHREEQQRYIREMAARAQQDFDESLTRDERKLIAAQAYWSSAQAHVEDHGTHIGALEQSELAAEAAAGVKSRSVRRWMCDYEASGGQFSESLWSKNTKTPPVG